VPKPIDRCLALLKCLADETRFKILLMLKDGERCVCEIFRELGKEQSLISHHLRVARRCGLVKGVRRGKWVIYKLADPSIAELLAKIDEISTKLTKDATDRIPKRG
jgi:ArsR family transcriptional regulator